jgi:hypothetical protein
METQNKALYKKEGAMDMATGAVVPLIVGIGVSVMVIILVGALGGKTYNIVEPSINNISDTDIKSDIQDSIEGGFQALSDLGDLLPLIVLAFVMGLVLFMVVGLGGVTNRGGSAL